MPQNRIAGVVLDASAAVFLVLPGAPVANLSRILQDVRIDGSRIIAPSILASEVAAAITKMLRMRRITRSEAEEAFEVWQQLLATDLFDLTDANALLKHAFDLSIRVHHPLHDCLYLVLALRDRAAYLTADEIFARKAHALGIHIELVS
ncbi:MAG TPA: type II toxin-antitoxin system VapC family toxin [Rhizomicrobium sp.]|jgi:predicted nucleic acid-binding protein